MKINCVKIPNRLIIDDSLSYSARKLGAVLYSRRNHLGTVSKSLESLSKLSGLAVSTVRKALDELDQGNYLTRCTRYKYDKALGIFVYAPTLYSLNLSFQGGFTLIPRSLFRKTNAMRGSDFTVCMYLYHQTGNNDRAFPSLNKMSADLKMAKSTVCRAIRYLSMIGTLLIQACRKINKAFACNSYFFLRKSNGQGATAPICSNPVLPCPYQVSTHSWEYCLPVTGRMLSSPAIIIHLTLREINIYPCMRVVRKKANKRLKT